MTSVFVRELRKYSFGELKDLFAGAHVNLHELIKQLKYKGIVKIVRRDTEKLDFNDLAIESIASDDITENVAYVFCYIGIIAFRDVIIKCYPKYIKSTSEPTKELKQVIKVIEKYDTQSQEINLYGDVTERATYNKLPVMLFLLKDYFDNGLYFSDKKTVDINGQGEILWDKTINNTFPLIDNDDPYYSSLYTKYHLMDEHNFFRRLHRCILSQISSELDEAGLTDLLDISGVPDFDENFEDFGEVDDIVYKIECEFEVQFNTRKRLLLQAMENYIVNKEVTIGVDDSISLFGVSKFEQIWEEVCNNVFGDRRNHLLGTFTLKQALDQKYNPRNTLLSVIACPQWHGLMETGQPYIKVASGTLIPDFLSIIKSNNKYIFVILDAKYYDLQLEKDKPLGGQPGIESVTKQYLYQQAYMDFIKKNHIDGVSNCFLLPNDSDEIIEKGYVSLAFMESLGLKNVDIRLLPAKKIFDCYLSNRKIDLKILNLSVGVIDNG